MSQTLIPDALTKVEKLKQERQELINERKKEEATIKYHRAKSEELLKDAGEHLKLVNQAAHRIQINSKRFFDKGTELEKLTGTKRIEFFK